jgi:UDP-glucose 4-epimerase
MYHLAATRINRCAKFNEEGHSFIADGGFKIVDYCAKNKIKLFFASSASVYDSPKKFPILESDPCIPPTLYGSAKLYTEHLILNYDKMYGFNYAINRFFSVYGPGMDCEGVYTEVIFNWLNNIKNGNKNITVYGNPDEKVLDLVFVKDVVNAIDMTTSYNKNDTYNVSTESGTTLSGLIKCIEHVTNVNLNVQVLPENRNDIEKKRVGSTEKLRNIGWQQNYSLENGIKETYEWIAGL